jgi:hypothetical protein
VKGGDSGSYIAKENCERGKLQNWIEEIIRYRTGEVKGDKDIRDFILVF